ncbi:MAG: GNAT family N-acetyltransferase [Trueperaceae bacterium]
MLSDESVRLAVDDDEINACFPVMRELRTHLDKGSFLSRVRTQEKQGYRLAYVRRDGECVAVAGFRIIENLAYGRLLYVDDLVTSAARRSTGVGSVLIEWLETHAREHGCERLHLDSGTQRTAAHRFYIRGGLEIVNFHFAKRI